MSTNNACFFRYSGIDIHNRRTFKFVQSSNVQSKATEIILCEQCSNHLTLDTKRKKKERIYDRSDNTWLGFIWYFITNQDLHRNYGMKVWEFIPFTWRHWLFENSSTHFETELLLQDPN